MLKIEEYQFFHQELGRSFPAYRVFYEDVIRGRTVISVELLAGSDFKIPKELWAPVALRAHTLLVGQRLLFPHPPEVERLAAILAEKIRKARKLTEAGRPLPGPKFPSASKAKAKEGAKKGAKPLEAGVPRLALGALKASGLTAFFEEERTDIPSFALVAQALLASRLELPKPISALGRLRPANSPLMEILGLDLSSLSPDAPERAAALIWLSREKIWPLSPFSQNPSPKIVRPWRPGFSLLSRAGGPARLVVSYGFDGKMARLAPFSPGQAGWERALSELGAEPGDLALLDEGAEPEAYKTLHQKRGLRLARAGRAAGPKPKGKTGEEPDWRRSENGLKWRPASQEGPGPALRAEADLPESLKGRPKILDFWGESPGFGGAEDLWLAARASHLAEETLRETDLKTSPDDLFPSAAIGFLAGRLLDFILGRFQKADLPGSWPEIKALLSEPLVRAGQRRAGSLPEARSYYQAVGAEPWPERAERPKAPKGGPKDS
ncbi:MAG: hypothetical protein LBE49_07630 [Deltaproteobacteria bacterium]|jgi:hypothetical protein|nr:hypothetical protein [Deltaproteobacteria bacterium]